MRPRSARARRPSAFKATSGQSLAELAILGSAMILLMTSLVSYGLRYNYQQKAMQHAFREALAIASENQQGIYTLVEDRHIPDLANPFGIGSVSPVIGSASVVRNPHMEETADDIDALPNVAFDMRGVADSTCPGGELNKDGNGGYNKAPCYYLTAGFSEVTDVTASDAVIDKYREIFGETVQGCKKVDSGNTECTGGWAKIYDYDDDGDRSINGKVDKEEGECKEEAVSPYGETYCLEYEPGKIKRIRFIDGSAGEVIDYETTKRQCRQIINEEFCKSECDRARPMGEDDDDDTTDCNTLCAQRIAVPWYCETEECGLKMCESKNTSEEEGDDGYNFTKLDEIFGFASTSKGQHPKDMGMQQSYTQEASFNNQLSRQESKGSFVSSETQDWDSSIRRSLVRLQYEKGRATGSSADVVTDEYVSRACESGEGEGCNDTSAKKTITWETQEQE